MRILRRMQTLLAQWTRNGHDAGALVLHGVDVERNRVLTSGLGHGERLGLVGELGWLARKLHSDDRRRIVVAVPAGADRHSRS